MATAKKAAKQESKQGPIRGAISLERTEAILALPALKAGWVSLAAIGDAVGCTAREARRAVRKAVADGKLKWEKSGVSYMVAAKSVKTKPPAPEPKAAKPKAEKAAKNAKAGKAAAKKAPAVAGKSAAKKTKPAAKRAKKTSDAGENSDSGNSDESGDDTGNTNDVLQ